MPISTPTIIDISRVGAHPAISRLLWTLPFNPVAKAGSDMTGRKVGPCRRPVPPLKANEMKMVEAAVAALSA
ncbi:hypothetical protein ACO2I3_19375 [Leptospira interrogans]